MSGADDLAQQLYSGSRAAWFNSHARPESWEQREPVLCPHTGHLQISTILYSTDPKVSWHLFIITQKQKKSKRRNTKKNKVHDNL